MVNQKKNETTKKFLHDNYTKIGANVRNETALKFKQFCTSKGITPSAAVKAYVEMVNAGNENAVAILQSAAGLD